MIFSSQLGKLDGYTNEQAVKAVANHLRKVQEELEYRLSVLDSENITEIDTNITKMSGPLIELIAENEKAVARLTIAGNEIRAEVSRELEGLSSTVSQTATQLRSEFANMKMEVESSFSQTASEIRAYVDSELSGVESSLSVRIGTIEGKVADAEGNVSTLTQTVSSLRSTVTSQGNSLSQVIQTSNAITETVYDLQTGMNQTVRLDANGFVISNATGTRTTINGGSIEADTVKVNSLYGSNVYFRDANGYLAADIAVTGSSSTYSQKVVLTSGAFEVETYGGSIYLHSMLGPSLLLGRRETSGPVYCQLTGGALLIDTDSYGPLSSRPSSGNYGQVYFALE